MVERGITASYESIRLWSIKFGPEFAKRLKRRHQGFGDTFYIDEVFVKIGGQQQSQVTNDRLGMNIFLLHWLLSD